MTKETETVEGSLMDSSRIRKNGRDELCAFLACRAVQIRRSLPDSGDYCKERIVHLY